MIGTSKIAQISNAFLAGNQKPRENVKRKSNDELNILQHKFAPFAAAGYERNVTGKKRKLEQYGQGDFDYDKARSNKEMHVYVNHKTKEVVTVNRGTQESDDMITNWAIAAGIEHITPRFKRAKSQYADVLKTYEKDEEGNDYKHYLVGHSLGGTINNALYVRYGDQIDGVFNFNPGSAGKPAIGTDTRVFHENVHNFYVENDPVSILGTNMKNSTNSQTIPLKTGQKGFLAPHDIDNFLI